MAVSRVSSCCSHLLFFSSVIVAPLSMQMPVCFLVPRALWFALRAITCLRSFLRRPMSLRVSLGPSARVAPNRRSCVVALLTFLFFSVGLASRPCSCKVAKTVVPVPLAYMRRVRIKLTYLVPVAQCTRTARTPLQRSRVTRAAQISEPSSKTKRSPTRSPADQISCYLKQTPYNKSSK